MNALALLLALLGDVVLDSGPISGQAIPGDPPVRVYRGIPYAAPPVGPLRWRPPAPVAPWTEVRPCVEFGPVCPQPSSPLRPGREAGRMDEDCLTLNVWTAAAGLEERRPVMVWIHGGGHVTGAGSLPLYDGTDFARSGVVLVTINYRLGPFGYLAHPLLARESGDGTAGNYGLLDQVAALRWVKRNVAAFGGDPERVTIFGESAGAVSVSCLMACPAAKGLFHRAIAESGGPGGAEPEMRFEQGTALEKALGCDAANDRLAAMRAKSWAEVLDAAKPEPATKDRARKYAPCVDGKLLPRRPADVWREGKVHDVPFLTGSNADDGSVFARNFPVRGAPGYRLAVRGAFPDHADEVLALFPPGDDVRASVRRLLTVSAFVAPARMMARGAAGGESGAWLYHFTRGLAIHGMEIPFVFRGGTAMHRMWVAFATTGNPNVEGLPEWPAYDPESDVHLEFGERPSVGARLYQRECDLMDRVVNP